MRNAILEQWLEIISSPDKALQTSLGTALWTDGLREARKLSVRSFLGADELLSADEKKIFHLLQNAKQELVTQKGFLVSGHAILCECSPFYGALNNRDALGDRVFKFVDSEIGEFHPWKDEVSLGTKFYSTYGDQIRIPFYTFNHENAHLTLFQKIYSNIEINDEQLVELFILGEWFCIASDLILAHDLIKAGHEGCFREICRVPFDQTKGGSDVFLENCSSIESVNKFANRFRSVFLNLPDSHTVYSLISRNTLADHWKYSKETLLKQARQVEAAMPAHEALDLLNDLKTLQLTDLISKYLGIHYAKAN